MVNIRLPFGRKEIHAVLDISPGGAAIAVLSQSGSGAAEVLSQGSSALSLEPRTAEQAKGLIEGQIKEAAEISLKLLSATGRSGPIARVYVVVHAPWCETQIVSARKQFEKEQRIQSQIIGALAQESVARVTTTTIEKSVIQVSLNGYPTGRPENKFARDLAVTSIVSSCDEAVVRATEGAVRQAFPVAQIVWRSATRAALSLAREARLGSEFLIVDVGSDDTHILSYREGTADQLVIPEGTRTILAKAAAGKSPEEVLGFLRMMTRDACSSDACDAIRTGLASAEPDLVRVFGESIAKISGARKVPNDVILLCHPDLEDWMTSFLSRIDFAQFSVTSLPLSLYTPERLDVGRWVAGAQSADALTVAAALVNIESRE